MIYDSFITAKTGEEIPLFISKRPMNSKYNPSLEAENFAQNQKNGFFVIGGIGNGMHIKALLKQFPSSFILAIEADRESLSYCLNFKDTKECSTNPSVRFITPDDIEEAVLKNYFPISYNNFTFTSLRSWQNENPALTEKINEEVHRALKKISGDFSVQSHFGKIWQHNIIVNFKNAVSWNYQADKEEALICAAGPGLEKAIDYIKEKKDSASIIAADTAFSTLLEEGIIADIVLSSDAQKVSAEHFYNCPLKEKTGKEILFILDLSTNPAIYKSLIQRGHKAVFYNGGHPLSLALTGKSLPLINAAGGTVTAACCDFAYKAGFKILTFAGADFSYPQGKAYARGTYLDRQYNSTAVRFSTAETKYSSLMYRTELVKDNENNNALTTEVMKNYRQAINEWAVNCGFKKESKRLSMDFNNNKISCTEEKIDFIPEKLLEENKKIFFPMCAWLKKYNGDRTEEELLKLALAYSLRYNQKYEN
ncbi:6-hydroxymethylpterin diphosphokinase MptE-like protein [Treponema sp.]|uniref:motility associated factor glycosyltransferase family protein n=1 Tax=Treponema sp. TaxID=166 RepID=UPI0025E221B0|nr:6-hydroxymethylpterin diphosphokinase MptE-like protein [Treponema sp.]MCR5218097.1 DUF115 domain-containing protein [Treponema sp.]